MVIYYRNYYDRLFNLERNHYNTGKREILYKLEEWLNKEANSNISR